MLGGEQVRGGGVTPQAIDEEVDAGLILTADAGGLELLGALVAVLVGGVHV